MHLKFTVKFLKLCSTLLLIAQMNYQSEAKSREPNIVIAMADDLGWADVSYNNYSGIYTPHIDKLAKEGIILNNHYVQPICSPSRASLLTGKYPIHIGVGLNENVFAPDEEYGLPLGEKLLPEHLKSFGYDTALFGKWHLGLAKTSYLPTRRGFDRFYGFYSGAIDYYTHIQTATRCSRIGKFADYLDLRDQERVVRDKTGKYSSYIFNEKALEFINEREKGKPFFLLMAYQNVHDPLQAPEDYIKRYGHFSDKSRRIYAGMASFLDDSIKNLTDRIKETGLWNDTLIIFMSDNGGNPKPGGCNWPLRGAKGTLWEGGIRSVSFLSGGYLEDSRFQSNALVHISDWFPTILALVKRHKGSEDGARKTSQDVREDTRKNSNQAKPGVEYRAMKRADTVGEMPVQPFNVGKSGLFSPAGTNFPEVNAAKEQIAIDGVDVWEAITSREKASPRQYIIHNINNQSYAIRKGKWKLITEIDMGWQQPPERTQNDQMTRTIDPKSFNGYLLDPKLSRIRNGLFNMEEDDREQYDLSEQNPQIVRNLLGNIDKYRKTQVHSNRVYKCNLKALEKAKKVNAWGPFLD